MKEMLNEWKKYITESQGYYEIDPQNPPSIREVLRRWASENQKAYEDEKQPDGRYYHARYFMTEIEPFLEYQWTREKARNSPEEWDELKASLSTEGLKSPLIIQVGKNFKAKVSEGNHRFAILKELTQEKGLYSRVRVPVRFSFVGEVF